MRCGASVKLEHEAFASQSRRGPGVAPAVGGGDEQRLELGVAVKRVMVGHFLWSPRGEPLKPEHEPLAAVA